MQMIQRFRDRMSESIHDKEKIHQPKPGVKRTKNPASVTLKVPTNIPEQTAMSNARYGIGARVLSTMIMV